MKKITTLFWALALPLFAFSQVHNSKISQDLTQRMDANPAAYQDIIIELADFVDAGALLDKYETEKTPLATRSYEVITRLQAKAAATQPEILARLSQLNGVEKGSEQPVWVINAIRVQAKPNAIETIASWLEVGKVSWNYPIEAESISNPKPSMPSPNGSEVGLRAIKAPFMWKKGYTGYGRKGMIIDTGEDGDHPALVGNFWGQQVPKAQAWHGSGYPEDCADHGTHVTGTMVGIDRKTNDTIGVAYNSHWIGAPMGFPVNPDGTGCTAELVQTIFDNVNSIQWGLNPDGNATTTADQPDVLNNSWRAGNVDCNTTAAKNAINALEAAGIAVVFAQGNAGPDPSTVTSGAAINTSLVNTFAVGAVNGASANLLIADFSSRGPSTCGGTGALLIKPEVSAPGVNVRSAFNNGLYSSIDGTSMAAPHVAGAILLLREAFPTLSGTQLKLALYNSATDLGVAGEDNIYGMGMINLESAFNYLVNDGNVPATPVSYERDVIVANMKVRGLCNGPVEVGVSFENGGTTPITSIQFSYGLENGTPLIYDWTGTLAPNAFVELTLPSVTGVAPGNYILVLNVVSVNGQADTRPLNNRFKTPFTLSNDEYSTAVINSLQTSPLCANSRVLLTYNTDLAANETAQWYNSPTSIAPLAEGKNYLTPVLTQNTTYYVTSGLSYNVGKTAITGNSALSNEGSLQFNADKAFKIKSVKVYADETGARIITLVNSLGAQIATRTVTISTVGEQRITLNFNVPVGDGYKLTLAGGKDFKHTTSGAGYPHNIQNVVSIIRGVSPAGANTTFTYYYFFDWLIELPSVCGRTPFEVTVADAPVAPAVNFEASPSTVDLAVSGVVNFTDLTTGSTAHFWDFGNQTTATTAQPSTTYTQTGAYKVFMIATTANGCANGIDKTITVVQTSGAQEPQDLSEKAVLFPNPTNGDLTLSFVAEFSPENADIEIVDLMGRTVHTQRNAIQNAVAQLDITALAGGVYFVLVKEKGNILFSGKFVKN
jgi:Subtilase family/Secretion system C-terminal sorting domain/Ig-like domain CHU_C associated/PKD domain